MQVKDSFKVLSQSQLNVQQLYGQILSILNEKLPNRVLSGANIFNMTVDIAHDLTMLTLMHIEDALVEQNILTAQKDLSVRGLATLTGHQATRPVASSGILNLKILPSAFMKSRMFTFDNVKFKNELNGLEYVNDGVFSVNREGDYVVKVKQIQWNEMEVVAEGNLSLFTVHVDDTEMITQDDIKVFVNGIQWTKFDSMYDSKSSDNAYYVKNGVDNQVDIIFGDGIHGKKLREGDIITCKYATTSGEFGNIINSMNFKIVSGVSDIQGDDVNLDDDIEYSILSGFQLGSNGENINVTKMIAGYSSRANVFTKTENLLAYLYRLSIVSYANVWTELDTNIYNVLLLPNLQINSYREYLTTENLQFTNIQKSALKEYIEQSGKQQTSTEIKWVDPQFKKYVIFVYIDTADSIFDAMSIKNAVETEISKIFIEKTFSKEGTQLIKREDITLALSNIDIIKQFTFDIFSEDNEVAKINGWYNASVEVFNGATKSIVTKRFTTTESTYLGFDEFGDIKVDKMQYVPILRAGFKKHDESGNHLLITSPINVFAKNRLNNVFELL